MAWRNPGRTLLWLLVSLAVTVGISAALWAWTGSPLFFGFLFLPFLFGGGRWFGRDDATGRPAAPRCVRCGYTTATPEGPFCPRCGGRLE